MKKQIWLSVCLFASEVFCYGQAAFHCSVSGQVVASRPTNMSLLRVEISDVAQHTRVATIPVMSDGAFNGPPLPNAQYIITVVTIRDEPVVEQVAQVSPGCNSITLRMPEDSSAKPASGTVSISRLAHQVPSNARKAFERSQRAFRSHNETAWIEHLKQAVAADPEFFEAQLNLGAAYMARDEPQQAREQFVRAVKLDESSVLAWTDLAVAQLRVGENDQAEESAKHALRLDNTSVAGHYALALSWVARGRYGEPVLTHLQSIYSAYPRARMVAAQTLAGLGRFDEAAAQVETYLQSPLQSPAAADRAKAVQYLRFIRHQQGR